jgi:hypothetical protein
MGDSDNIQLTSAPLRYVNERLSAVDKLSVNMFTHVDEFNIESVCSTSIIYSLYLFVANECRIECATQTNILNTCLLSTCILSTSTDDGDQGLFLNVVHLYC